jgi:diacylglycerol kinase family enzyme
MVGSPVPLAILPAGTANVLANELGLGSRMLPAAARIADCVPRRISIGQVQLAPPHAGRYFLLMAGAGLDAHVVFHLDLSLKARLGKVAYWVSGFSQFGRVLEEFDVAIDGRQHRCSLALISKVRNYGGDLEIAREVRLTDDQFEVVLFAGASSYAYLKYLLGVATRQTARIQGITTHRAGEVRLAPREGETVHLQVDGEYAGRLPGTIKLIHDALTLLIPPSYAPSPR